MSLVHAERCGCGEQHAVEIPGVTPEGRVTGEPIACLRLHDLEPIERCRGCGRPFAEMLDESERWGDELWDDGEGEEPAGFGCGGIKTDGAA